MRIDNPNFAMAEVDEASDDDLAAWADESTAKTIEVEVPTEKKEEEPQVGEKRPMESQPTAQAEEIIPSPSRARLNINKTDKSIGSHRNRDSKEVRCKYAFFVPNSPSERYWP